MRTSHNQHFLSFNFHYVSDLSPRRQLTCGKPRSPSGPMQFCPLALCCATALCHRAVPSCREGRPLLPCPAGPAAPPRKPFSGARGGGPEDWIATGVQRSHVGSGGGVPGHTLAEVVRLSRESPILVNSVFHEAAPSVHSNSRGAFPPMTWVCSRLHFRGPADQSWWRKSQAGTTVPASKRNEIPRHNTTKQKSPAPWLQSQYALVSRTS